MPSLHLFLLPDQKLKFHTVGGNAHGAHGYRHIKSKFYQFRLINFSFPCGARQRYNGKIIKSKKSFNLSVMIYLD